MIINSSEALPHESTVKWTDIRELVRAVHPKLAAVIDSLSPNYPLKLKTAGYGTILANQEQVLNPSMVLDKTCELYFKYKNQILPYRIYKPGDLILTAKRPDAAEWFYQNSLWECMAGCRSAFILPGISDYKQHQRLLDHYQIEVSKPLGFEDHWHIFRAIAASPMHQNLWQAQILEFSDEWFKHQEDLAWLGFYSFFDKAALQQTKVQRSKALVELLFGILRNERHYKFILPHLEQVSHLFMIGLGGIPGFRPATETIMPVKNIQKAYQLIYRLKSYAPIIMGLDNFDFNADSKPIYYSLNYQTSYLLSLPENETETVAKESQLIHWLLDKFCSLILSEKFISAQSELHHLIKGCQFHFYHQEAAKYREFTTLEEVAQHDQSFLADWKGLELHLSNSFLKGCVGISSKAA